ncbi:hypothetical protein GGR56DRAFT_511450 [Xylariaceae sp. FL0804]|nr:hypothetical protein GGR56DRAFT_511450 [Xylariaceae sp. FL0804]
MPLSVRKLRVLHLSPTHLLFRGCRCSWPRQAPGCWGPYSERDLRGNRTGGMVAHLPAQLSGPQPRWLPVSLNLRRVQKGPVSVVARPPSSTVEARESGWGTITRWLEWRHTAHRCRADRGAGSEKKYAGPVQGESAPRCPVGSGIGSRFGRILRCAAGAAVHMCSAASSGEDVITQGILHCKLFRVPWVSLPSPEVAN